MSSWDAPTGNWGSRQEPDESGRPDEQDYQQGESTGGYGTMRGDEGRLRTGRRGLPGYEQAQKKLTEERAEALRRWSEHVAGLVAGKPSNVVAISRKGA